MTLSNLEQMTSHSYGMDILIISVSSSHEELFWKKRLDMMRGQIIKEDARIILVVEDWENGAGNALGTLYAFLKANEKMQEIYREDLLHCLEKGDAIALYHTAGKGTRLAPLTGCEHNSKSRIKLVGSLFYKHQKVPITLLETVIKQTSIFAPKRKGRLSVFWGDQLFIPSLEIEQIHHEVDLLTKLLPTTPSKEEWIKNNYSRYGLVIASEDKTFQQLEKLEYSSFSKFKLKENQQIGLSLGSFSLSKKILDALLEEFKPELSQKKGSFDTDPHLWMPLSLEKKDYLNIFKRKKWNLEEAEKHYDRMHHFKEKFLQNSHSPLLGVSDMGIKTLWWDYGNNASYYLNSLKLIEQTEEAEILKTFFQIPKFPENHPNTNHLKIENSILINCSIQQGIIKNSVLIDVIAQEVQADSSVLVQTSAQKIDAKEVILYNVVENGSICLKGHKVRADIFLKSHGHTKLHNSIFTPIPWNERSQENPFSFSKLHQLNKGLHPLHGQQCAQTARNQVKQAVINMQTQEQE